MKIKIKLKIAQQDYPMTIPAEEEAYCRSAGKTINEHITATQRQYPSLELEKNLVLNAIEHHVNHLKQEAEALKQIKALHQLIDQVS